MNPRLKRRLRRVVTWSVVAFVLFVTGANRWVINSTDAYLYADSSLLPDNEVGLVLGCSPYVPGGDPNPQFHGRIKAAADLYKTGKVRRLILSGANPDQRYNEPKKMREALLEHGIPSEAMVLDFAGNRTLESVTRLREVFGLDRATVITQKYHSYRALFLARKQGMHVVAFQAPIEGRIGPGFRHPPREIFARAAAVLEIGLVRVRALVGATPAS